mmetsp:Transcript_18548/g.31077  ORF Transcript_18548/g.31077 Transcript_18548/m.31077 type:complete len:234 (-) Transcript_18548:382-1083(-)
MSKHVWATNKVIQSNASIYRASKRALRPVSELSTCIWIQIAKRIFISCFFQHGGEGGSFLRSQPSLLINVLRIGIVDIQVQMTAVQVACKHHSFALVVFLQVAAHVSIPLIYAIRQPHQPVTRVRNIASQQDKPIELNRYRATLSMELLVFILEIIGYLLDYECISFAFCFRCFSTSTHTCYRLRHVRRTCTIVALTPKETGDLGSRLSASTNIAYGLTIHKDCRSGVALLDS